MAEETGLLTSLDDEQAVLTGILTGEPNRVDVVVEDEFDVPFWFNILQSLYPDRSFHVSPYQYETSSSTIGSLEKGKRHILDEAKAGRLGLHNIGCVDSDYDYLLSKDSDYWNELSSPFVLQTYTYSIENLMCLASTLKDVCCKSAMEVPEFDFESFFERISCELYPLLAWVVYFEKNRMLDFVATRWSEVLTSEKVWGHYSADEMVECVKDNVDVLVADFNAKYADCIGEMHAYSEDVFGKRDVTPQNCYLFVRGHNLFSYVKSALLEPIVNDLFVKHESEIKSASADGIQKGNNISHYHNNRISVGDVLNRNYEFQKCPGVFDRIKSDVIEIFC